MISKHKCINNAPSYVKNTRFFSQNYYIKIILVIRFVLLTYRTVQITKLVLFLPVLLYFLLVLSTLSTVSTMYYSYYLLSSDRFCVAKVFGYKSFRSCALGQKTLNSWLSHARNILFGFCGKKSLTLKKIIENQRWIYRRYVSY